METTHLDTTRRVHARAGAGTEVPTTKKEEKQPQTASCLVWSGPILRMLQPLRSPQTLADYKVGLSNRQSFVSRAGAVHARPRNESQIDR